MEHGVAFTIATDGPEMMRTHLRDELDLLRRIGALDGEELAEANARGHEAGFVLRKGVLLALELRWCMKVPRTARQDGTEQATGNQTRANQALTTRANSRSG